MKRIHKALLGIIVSLVLFYSFSESNALLLHKKEVFKTENTIKAKDTTPLFYAEVKIVKEVKLSEEEAIASFYAERFHGRKTSNGEKFDMNALTAAHKTLPFGTKVRVVNVENGKEVIVTINDGGPFVKGRSFDLSKKAFSKIAPLSKGKAKIRYQILSSDEIEETKGK